MPVIHGLLQSAFKEVRYMANFYKIGSTGDDVKKLQQQLASAGFDPGGADGIYGPKTQAAVTAYQKANNLDVDGIAGVQTLGSLNKPVTTAPVITPLNTSPATPAVDPDRELAKQYASGAINLDQLNTGMDTIRGRTTPTAPVTPDLSGLTNLNLSPAAPAQSYQSPWEDKINAALDRLLGYNPNTPYDVTTDPLYNPLKQQYDAAGKSAFNNQVGRLSALTGGRPSTAAVGTATAAQNDYAQEFSGTVLPSLISAEQTRKQNEYNNILGQLEALQGFESQNYDRYRDTVADTRAAEEKKVSDFLSTIGQYSDNYQARINEVTSDNDPTNDFEESYLKAYRQEKIANMQAAQAAAEEKAAEARTAAEQEAYERSVEQAKLASELKYTDAQIANMAADNARAAAAARKESGTLETLGTTEQLQRYYDYLTSFTGGGGGTISQAVQNDPSTAPTLLMQNKRIITGKIGEKLYNQLASDVETMLKTQKNYGMEEQTDYSKDPVYTTEMDLATRDPEAWLENYKEFYQDYYNKFGIDVAQKLANAAETQLEKNTGSLEKKTEKETTKTQTAKYQEYYALAESDLKAFKKKMKDEKTKILNEVGIENYEKLKMMLK
jgi:peptidoglycan hydrolase-like protein with peptidoglycan-binding domain